MKKKEYKMRLVNSIVGWQLIPVNEESYDALDKFYGVKYSRLKPSERSLIGGRYPVEQAVSFVKRVCKLDGNSVSFCGNKLRPTIRVWINQ